ncbi:16298_t:CDS:2 [Gigaspora margarita]|uniref:16298_t:CDS:1 n=1 Tax=Gigaspora margarita TaxID=4874 RepID=A0ABN7VFG2_GIGMA|nr:16298_t:CDS:2 [Gigaspora margarita]
MGNIKKIYKYHHEGKFCDEKSCHDERPAEIEEKNVDVNNGEIMHIENDYADGIGRVSIMDYIGYFWPCDTHIMFDPGGKTEA